MLKIKELHSYYGAIEAIKGIELSVGEKEICCLIGANGAGKTSTLKSISGMITRKGSIVFDGNEIIYSSPIAISKAGIMHVPEGRHVFPGLSVYENLEVGTANWHGFFGNKPYKEDMEKVFEIFPRLKERNKQLAWSLSGGEQQMLAIGRALMGHPKLLLLDEPSMGLAPVIVAELFEKIVEINKIEGIPILLIEQNAKLALEVSHHAYVIEQGKITIEGRAKELRNDPRVVEAYLGKFKKSVI
ncbi:MULTISPECIES: ABC transporter ATP-binding protein [Lacrimispora]|uniref:Amino acid ABC transporter ATPase n=1 Tax=Lacrimispora celerecrescens TaxID=29354 RepID=A0A084JL86_9FIRM|nr:ABC transporter ATP-binding protein [Lacrimispora celerecrescens]KEZ89720.1 amino acid ABC transporter ATPase [Lacrimispora celerecrescens]